MHRRVTVVIVSVCVCLSVKSHLTSGESVCPVHIVTYSVGNGGQKICGVFSETALLWRSSTPPLKAMHSVGHFPAESAHAHYSIKGHEYPHRGFCTLVHSFLCAVPLAPSEPGALENHFCIVECCCRVYSRVSLAMSNIQGTAARKTH